MSEQAALKVEDPDSMPGLHGKRVLYILPQPFFLTRGSSFRALATVRGLASLGLEVDLVAFPIGEKIDLEGVNLHRSMGVPGVRYVPIGPSFRKLALDSMLFVRCFLQVVKKRYDVIHGVEEGGIIAAFLAKALRRPYIFDMHSWMSVQLEDAGFNRPRIFLDSFRKLEEICIKNAAALITVGTLLTEKAAKLAPQVPGFTLEDHALEVSEVSAVEKESIRRELSLNHKRVILYTGNFESYQGIDLLLESFAHFCKQPTSPRDLPRVLLLVGGGSNGSPTIEKYREIADRLGIADRVVFAGQRGVKEMGAFMDIADVLVSPRIHGENTPLKIYSYMAAGKIIVATRIRSHTQVLDDENAILADPSAASFSDALKVALDFSPQAVGQRAEKLARAKEAVELRFSEREFFKRVSKCYEVVLKN